MAIADLQTVFCLFLRAVQDDEIEKKSSKQEKEARKKVRECET